MKQPMPDSLSGMKPPAGAQTTAGKVAGPAAGGAMPTERTEPPTPQEQAAYDAIVKQAARVVHDEKYSDTLAAAVMQAPDKARAMGQAVATVMTRVLTEAKKQGAPVPLDVIIPATEEVYQLVAEIGDRIGALPPDDEQAMTRGWLEAADATRVALVEAGVITQQEAAADIPEMQAMDGGGGAPAAAPAPAAGAGGFGAMKGAAR